MTQRPPHEPRHFVNQSRQHGDRVFCADCIPDDVDVSEADTQVWLEYSDGWLSPPICDACCLAIPVYVNVNPRQR